MRPVHHETKATTILKVNGMVQKRDKYTRRKKGSSSGDAGSGRQTSPRTGIGCTGTMPNEGIAEMNAASA